MRTHMKRLTLAKLKLTKKKKKEEEEESPHPPPPLLPLPPPPLLLPPAILLRSILATLPLFFQLATILATRRQVQVDGCLSEEDSGHTDAIWPIRVKQEVHCGADNDDNNNNSNHMNNHNHNNK
ncbi:uncharacterized protein LOC144022532 isoform X3 [Festucalex cinctus]